MVDRSDFEMVIEDHLDPDEKLSEKKIDEIGEEISSLIDDIEGEVNKAKDLLEGFTFDTIDDITEAFDVLKELSNTLF